MNRLNLKMAVGALALVLAGTAAYWYFSPNLTMLAMQRAAERKDAQAFNAHVDYPRLRESIKTQMNEVMDAQLGGSSAGNDPFAAMGAALARALVEPLINMMVSPEFMMYAMKNGDLEPPTGDKPAAATKPDSEKVEWDIRREGVDRVMASPIQNSAPQDQQASVVFERSGFATWKLVDLRLR